MGIIKNFKNEHTEVEETTKCKDCKHCRRSVDDLGNCEYYCNRKRSSLIKIITEHNLHVAKPRWCK